MRHRSPPFPDPDGAAGSTHFAGADSLARRARADALRAAADRPPPSTPRRLPDPGKGGDWPRPPACLTASRLDQPPEGARVAVCGLVIVRQRPGSAKGVLFVTLEDETGVVNVVVWARVYEANRRAVLAGRLLRITGRIQRDGAVVHVVAETIEDVSALLDTLTERHFPDVQTPADEVRRPQAEGSRPPKGQGETRARTLVRNAMPRAMHPREQARHLFRREPGG